MLENTQQITTRLHTDMLLDGVMDRARGKGDNPVSKAHDRIKNAAITFALTAAPGGHCQVPVEGYDVVSSFYKEEVSIRISHGDRFICISGPKTEPLLWKVDEIDAEEAFVVDMLKKVGLGWRRGH
ncbi:hypothetical protein ACFOY8_13620 [Thalassospira xianhensis]|uniref:Uncharacterized protein n=1 Tax=Thalassospira xiamenensis TaxID=220697 RepID=A0A285TU34_9PROT|nr:MULTISPECIES: hypothetical protein [Thalassospira]SOC26881.1 hypothetical protein SAMN05428964_105225 [Thalassospira xiamenensis]